MTGQELTQVDSLPSGQADQQQPQGPPFPYDNKVIVKVSEAIGVIAMSIFALILLIALLRAQAQIRELQRRVGGTALGLGLP